MSELLRNLELDQNHDDGGILADCLEELAESNSWPDKALFALQVASDEWISNVIKYSYEGQDNWRIGIEVRSDSRNISVVVRDNGRTFNPVKADIPSDLSETLLGVREGGMGLMVMHHVLDEIEFEQNGTENMVTMSMLV